MAIGIPAGAARILSANEQIAVARQALQDAVLEEKKANVAYEVEQHPPSWKNTLGTTHIGSTQMAMFPSLRTWQSVVQALAFTCGYRYFLANGMICSVEHEGMQTELRSEDLDV